MSKTSRAEYRYIVKEFEDGTPWIMCEVYQGDDLPLPGSSFLGFDLREGTTLSEAKEIARFMEANLRFMNMTMI